MPQARRPILRACSPKLSVTVPKVFSPVPTVRKFWSSRVFAMAVEQPSCKLRAVAADRAGGALWRRASTRRCPLCRWRYRPDRNRKAPRSAMLRACSSLRISHVAAKLPMPRPATPEKRWRQSSRPVRATMRHQAARPRSISIIAVIGVRSYPASAACSARTAGCSPFDARAKRPEQTSNACPTGNKRALCHLLCRAHRPSRSPAIRQNRHG